MKNFKSVISLIILTCTTLASQQKSSYSIDGIVLNKEKLPIKFSIVSIFSILDSVQIDQKLTDDRGHFSFSQLKANVRRPPGPRQPHPDLRRQRCHPRRHGGQDAEREHRAALQGHRLGRADAGQRPRPSLHPQGHQQGQEGQERQTAAHHRQDHHRQGHSRSRRHLEGPRRGWGEVRRRRPPRPRSPGRALLRQRAGARLLRRPQEAPQARLRQMEEGFCRLARGASRQGRAARLPQRQAQRRAPPREDPAVSGRRQARHPRRRQGRAPAHRRRVTAAHLGFGRPPRLDAELHRRRQGF